MQALSGRHTFFLKWDDQIIFIQSLHPSPFQYPIKVGNPSKSQIPFPPLVFTGLEPSCTLFPHLCKGSHGILCINPHEERFVCSLAGSDTK